jgi:hypothetical protein
VCGDSRSLASFDERGTSLLVPSLVLPRRAGERRIATTAIILRVKVCTIKFRFIKADVDNIV